MLSVGSKANHDSIAVILVDPIELVRTLFEGMEERKTNAGVLNIGKSHWRKSAVLLRAQKNVLCEHLPQMLLGKGSNASELGVLGLRVPGDEERSLD